MSSYALINPEILAWARHRSGLSFAELVDKMRPISAERLSGWERRDSEDRPTFKQAQKLADVLHVPFGYLFLTTAPRETLPLPDLRTKRHPSTVSPSPNFLEVLYDALRKQEWYREYLDAQDAPRAAFVGKYSVDTEAEVIAKDIRATLRLTDDLRRRAKDNDDYFRTLVRQCEAAGIVVLRNSVVGNNTHRPLDPDEFQGFAIADPVAPVVFVNQRDYLSAQIFTLLHEVAHIWLGATGVSDPEYLEVSESNNVPHQRLADKVAADVLVSATEFSLRWSDRRDEDIESRIERLRRFYKVSVFVVLRRAYDLGEVTPKIFRQQYERLRREIKPRAKGGGGGGYSTILSRNSPTVSTAVIQSVSSGALQPTEGALLLNVRTSTLYSIEHQLSLGAL